MARVVNSMVNEEYFWPTLQQELLLKAAFCAEEEAIEAWKEWKSHVDVDHLDNGSKRVLPLLYKNMKRHGFEDQSGESFTKAYLHNWYYNHELFRSISPTLKSFQNAGIRTLILKGAALVFQYYKDYGYRPMSDFDVLVPFKQASMAIDLLDGLKWVPKFYGPEVAKKLKNMSGHGHGFVERSGGQIDLHWHLLKACCHPDMDIDFWEHAVPVKVLDVSTFALHPTDQFLHVCLHGAQCFRNLYWAADAMTILRTSRSDINWKRLVLQSKKLISSLQLKDALYFLKDVLKAPIPYSVLTDLDNTAVSRSEQKEVDAIRIPHSEPEFIWNDWLFCQRYVRQSGSCGFWDKAVNGMRYFQQSWTLKSLWTVPFYFVYSGIRRVLRSILKLG